MLPLGEWLHASPRAALVCPSAMGDRDRLSAPAADRVNVLCSVQCFGKELEPFGVGGSV
jgi:hypothetical protein